MATAHLLFGFLGVGKTTFARQLERDIPAVRFSPDEWITRLYGNDPPAERFEQHVRDVHAIVDELWPRVLAADTDVILDFGFWSRADRDAARLAIEKAGADLRWYWVQCADSLAREGCHARNQDLRGSFHIANRPTTNSCPASNQSLLTSPIS